MKLLPNKNILKRLVIHIDNHKIPIYNIIKSFNAIYVIYDINHICENNQCMPIIIKIKLLKRSDTTVSYMISHVSKIKPIIRF